MLFYKDKTTTETYNTDFGFKVDIVETTEQFEAWVYHSDYGIKTMMFGSGKRCKEDFVQMVVGNLWDYVKYYMDDVLDDEELVVRGEQI